jgi:predicted HicB family RNase H-like nuclease
MLLHKGFIGKIDYDEREERLSGEVVNAPDLLEFDGNTAKQLQQNFIKCVDDYLTINQESGEEGTTSLVGQFSLHLSNSILDNVMRKAKREGSSIETWLNRWANASLIEHFKKE